MKDIAIVGAGGFGREVKMLIDQINVERVEYNFIGYFDDAIERGMPVNDSFVLGKICDLNLWDRKLWIILAIGDPSVKEKIDLLITNPLIVYPILRHPGVLIGDMTYNKIGEGTIICGGVIITVNTQIGKHVILNLCCTVGHDTSIGDYCSLMPAVNVSGEVNMMKGVYVGTGVKIINKLEIGQSTIIGAGAVVAKSLPPNCTAVGIPARPINK